MKLLDFGLRHCILLLLAIVLMLGILTACRTGEETSTSPKGTDQLSMPKGLLVALAVLDKDEDDKPVPLPARLGILQVDDGKWTYRTLEDVDSNVFHKAMTYRPADGLGGLLTLGGSRALVKLWRRGHDPVVVWEADFGGRFSRMRDAEVADLYGDGRACIAVATHDQGVVAIVCPDGAGGFSTRELDRTPDTFVHEIEVGDLDGDGVVEIYATPSVPNKLDGTPQSGQVVRYVPAANEGPTVVADLGRRHAKEILVDDVDGDGRDELYVVVEAVSGGKVEIRRFEEKSDPLSGKIMARLDDTLCRFLTAGDIDGDGGKEIVAAAYKSGLWLLRPEDDGSWSVTSIDRDSSGFEHAAVLADLDEDGTDELYVASDEDHEIRRYVWQDGEPVRRTLYQHTDGLARFTWNLMPVPVELMP